MKKMAKLFMSTMAAVMMFAGAAQALTIVPFAGDVDNTNWLLALYGQQQQSRNVVLFDQPLVHTGSLMPQTTNVDFITLASGTVRVNASVSSQNIDPLFGVSYTAPPGAPSILPVWRDQVSTGTTTTFSFLPGPLGTTAIGAMFNMQDPYGMVPAEGVGLTFTLLLSDGTTQPGGSTGAIPSGFWGWWIDPATNPAATFTTISGLLIESSTGAPQTFGMTQLEFNQVPEPSTFLLLGAGLGGLVFLRRRK